MSGDLTGIPERIYVELFDSREADVKPLPTDRYQRETITPPRRDAATLPLQGRVGKRSTPLARHDGGQGAQ